jgi:RNA polymerase sigma-70 factor (ECF subfamily)
MDLVTDAGTGREKAFLRQFDEHHGALFRFAFRLTGSAADAEDVVQECFLELLRPTCAFDPTRGPLRTWLFGIARNQSLKRLRKRENPGAESTAAQSPETELLRNEVSDLVSHAVGQLPEKQREVLVLSHYEKMPLAEIAAFLEIDIGAVKSRLQRARAALKESLAVCRVGKNER